MTLHGVSLSRPQTFLANNPCEDPLHVGCDGVNGQCVQVKARSDADPSLSDGCTPAGHPTDSTVRTLPKTGENILKAFWHFEKEATAPVGLTVEKMGVVGTPYPFTESVSLTPNVS
ncbi:hypothetical protein HDU85_007817 [Gaertneriomyces sp. JEL0708]|nr:hypothetical protein HDU85_007817 [Gaertneriomyces sp. JEL0708]